MIVNLSPHFSNAEFSCKCGKCKFPVDKLPQLKRLCEKVLEPIRARFGKPVVITSGYRCPAHNAAIGGAKDSQHTHGIAADIQVQGIAPSVVAKYAETLADVGGIGLYGSWVHVDTRPRKGGAIARWNG